jgi:hypothetical protein
VFLTKLRAVISGEVLWSSLCAFDNIVKIWALKPHGKRLCAHLIVYLDDDAAFDVRSFGRAACSFISTSAFDVL